MEKEYSCFHPPKSWHIPNIYFKDVIEHPWYQGIFDLIKMFHVGTNDFFISRGFSPALTPVSCNSVTSPMGLGSDSKPVSIELFGKPTYLADSMQFHLEYLLRNCKHGIYYIMQTFRGEDPDERHLNQFFHSEAEIIGNFEDVIKLVEMYVTYITAYILKSGKHIFDALNIPTDHLTKVIMFNQNFPRIKYSEAIKTLHYDNKYTKEVCPDIKMLTSLGEQKLIELHDGPVWVTHFPVKSVPFYQAIDEESGNTLSADLLMGIGEIVGCGERYTTESALLNSMELCEVSADNYRWYLEMKKNYPLQTSGFGLGMERYLLWLLKHDDIRDLTIFNRLKGYNAAP